MGKLSELTDPDTRPRIHPLSSVHLREDLYRGPHVNEASDLIVSWKRGYRTYLSWRANEWAGDVVADNARRWSGDHVTVDPALVPGVFFCSQTVEASRIGLEDVAPTVLALLGVTPSEAMDGQAVLPGVKSTRRS
jgi:predicted AlkP superfamily phosphohydrolase/phosphomutase